MFNFAQWFAEVENLIPRSEMPQIKEKYRDNYFDFLKKYGVNFSQQRVMPDQLKPSQSNFDPSKINQYIDNPCKTGLFTKRILVSADNYILDGHHHWQAMLKGFPNRPIPVFKANINFQNLLQLSKKFPKVKFQGVAEE
jgi:hypothetical protein